MEEMHQQLYSPLVKIDYYAQPVNMCLCSGFKWIKKGVIYKEVMFLKLLELSSFFAALRKSFLSRNADGLLCFSWYNCCLFLEQRSN